MTFEQFLASTKADTDTVHRALRLHLSELIGDLTPDAMHDQLRAAVDDSPLLDEGIRKLATDSACFEKAALDYFGEFWTDERQQPSIVASFAQANGRLQANSTLSAVDSAVFAVYGLYLAGIRGALVALCGGSRAHNESTRPNGLLRIAHAAP